MHKFRALLPLLLFAMMPSATAASTAAPSAPPRFSLELLGAPAVKKGFARSQANAISASGHVAGVGNYEGTSIALSGRPSLAPLSSLLSARFSSGRAVNAAGTVAGIASFAEDSETRGFVAGATTLSKILPLEGDAFTALSFIDDAGRVAGSSGTSGGFTQAIWANPEQGYQARALPLPRGAESCRAKGLAGEYAFGDCRNERREDFPVCWDLNGEARALGLLPGAFEGILYAVNEAGIAVGASVVGALRVATRWDGAGAARALGTLPGHNFSEAVALNSAGLAVGYSSDQTRDAFKAVLFIDSAVYDLESLVKGASPFASLDRALGINNEGAIVGYGTLKKGGIRAYLLRPVAAKAQKKRARR